MARRTATQSLNQPANFTGELPYLWSPRSYQDDIFNAMPIMQKYNPGKIPPKDRFVLVWHRKAGKDLAAFALTTREMYSRAGYYVHILPTFKQAKSILWDGMDDSGVPFLSRFPAGMVKSKSETELQVVCHPGPGQASGAIWQLRGADDPDSLRGPNYVGAVFSEFSEMDEMVWTAVVQPVLEQNGGWAMFIFTPKGENHSHRLYKMAKSDPRWFAQLLTVNDTRRDSKRNPAAGVLHDEDGSVCVSAERIEQLRKEGTPEEIIQQEYFCSFTGFLRGTIFGDLLTKARAEHRIGRFPWNSNMPVGTIWDIGRYDHTAIWFYQRLGESICFIDYYEDRLKGADFYAKLVREKPYLLSKHILPFDAKAKAFTAEYSTEEFLARTLRGVTVAPKLPVQTQIDIARRMFSRCCWDEVNCGLGLSHLENYRRKYSEDLKSYSGDPIHDEHSHGSSAFMTGASGGMSQPLEFHDEGYNMAAPMRECDFDVFAARVN